jgi:hypothetical protein
MEKNEFNAAIERLKKIKQLADRGIDGEAEAAALMLGKGLKRLGLTLAHLQSVERTEQQIGYDNDMEKRLISQVVASMGLQPFTRTRNGRMLKKVCVDCTPTELAELTLRLEFYLITFRKECEDLYVAYIYKHDIFPAANIAAANSGPEMDMERAKKLHNMMQGLGDETYQAPLTRIGDEGEDNG